MNNTEQISIESLTNLFIMTYQGTSSQSINSAFIQLLEISKNNSPPFINACQGILQVQCKNRNLCQSIANFIKVLTKIVIDQKIIDPLGSKDFINRIQHIFDNTKIPAQFKQNIAISYIKAALHYRISFEKICQKISYLYRVKDIQHAVVLSRSYLGCDRCIDPKSQGYYYKKILPLQLKYIQEQIISYKNIVSSQGERDLQNQEKITNNIQQLLKNIHSSLVFIAFQKFQSSIYGCLKNKQIVQIIDSTFTLRKNKQIIGLMRQIIQKIIENLFRMKRMQKIPALMESINSYIHQEWRQYQERLLNDKFIHLKLQSQLHAMDSEEEKSIVRLLTAAFNSHIILIYNENLDFWNLFIQPLSSVEMKIFQFNRDDIKEGFLLFEDSCFAMKSECLEVEFNRLLKSVLSNCPLVSSKIMLYLDQILFENHNLFNFQQKCQEKILLLMNFVAFQASYFMTQQSFIHKIQNFLKINKQQLFNHQNIKLYFHSLLLLYNYLDDIFCEDLDTQIFQLISKNFVQKRIVINSQTNNNFEKIKFIGKFEKNILRRFYSAGFSECQIEKQVIFFQSQSQLIIHFLTCNFDSEGIQIFIEIIKNYNIDVKITLQILDKILEFIKDLIFTKKVSIINAHHQIQSFIQFLVNFFNIEAYKFLFESTLSRVLHIFEFLISNGGQFEDEFFNLIKNVTKHLQYVPQNYLSWMENLYNSQRLQSQQSFKSLVVVLKYISPSKQTDKNLTYQLFVNSMALHLLEILKRFNQFENNNLRYNNVSIIDASNSTNKNSYFIGNPEKNFSKKQLLTLLCLHQLIYYHSLYFTRKVLTSIIKLVDAKIILHSDQNLLHQKTQSTFSFIIGKYKLIFVLLFKRRLLDVNQILIYFGLEKQIYNAVYMKDNHYLIEYDTPLLIKQQIYIFRKIIHEDRLQMTYANTAFLTIFYKLFLLYRTKNNQHYKFECLQSDSFDSDEEDFESNCQFKANFKQMTKLVLNFPKPDEWTGINELKEIKQFILQLRSKQSSKQWLKLLIDKCLNKQQKKFMEELMRDLENINGKYRHILKINKNISQSGFYNKSGEDTNI